MKHLLYFFFLIPQCLIASEFSTTNWAETEIGKGAFSVSSREVVNQFNQPLTQLFIAETFVDGYGEKRLQFSTRLLVNNAWASTCPKDYKTGDQERREVWRVNGLPVKLNVFCKQSGDFSFLTATSRTYDDRTTIVNQFLKNYVVMLEFQSTNVKFNAKGFTLLWNKLF